MPNGQEEIFDLQTALDVERDTALLSLEEAVGFDDRAEPIKQEFGLGEALQVSEPVMSLEKALAERDLTSLEKFGLDLTQFAFSRRVGDPQSRFFSGVNSFMQGLGDLAGGFLQSVAAVDKRLADNMAAAARFAKPSTIREDILEPGSVEDFALFKAGEDIRTMLEEAFPENPEFRGEFLASVLPRGVGTVAGQALTLPLGGPISTVITTMGFSGLEYAEALEATGDENTAFNTMLLNMPVNALEQLPLLAAIGRINKGTGGGFVKLMKRLAQTRTGVGLMEGTQEVVQEYTTNLIASNMYDSTRDLIASLEKAGGAGLIIGFAARSIGISLRQRINDPNSTPHERAEAINTLEFLREETSRMIREGRIDRGQVEEVFRLTGTRAEGARVGRQRPRPIPPLEAVEETIIEIGQDIEGELLGDSSEQGLSMAARDPETGDVHVRPRDEAPTHVQLLEQTELDPESVELGFVSPEGKFLNRNEAAQYQQAIQKGFETTAPGVLLAEEIEGQPQEAQGARVGRRRRRGFVPGVMFDPDIVPLADALVLEMREKFNSKKQPTKDISNNQSTLVVDPEPKTFWGKFKKGFKNLLAPEGRLPKKVWETAFEEGGLNRYLKQMFFVLNDLKKALKIEYNISSFEEVFYSSKIPTQTMQDLRSFLNGTKDASILPERLRVPAWEMRSQIDQLLRRVLKLGIVEGDLDISVREDIGTYIFKTYKASTQLDWAKKVSPTIKNRARAFIGEQFKELEGLDLTPNQVENIINTLLYRAKTSPIRVALQGEINGINLNPLKKSEDIPEPIRQLMGEELNPIVNYVKSVNAIANLIHQQKVLTELSKRFRGVYFWEPDDPNIPANAIDMVATKGSEVWAPIAGLKTTPEIAAAIKERVPNWASQSQLFAWYLRLNAGAKFAKTVLNPTTVSRNVIGGSIFLMMNGHNPIGGNFKKGLEAAKAAFVNPNSPEGRRRVLEYAELNLLGSSPESREINDLMGDISQAENYDQLSEFMMGRGLKGRLARGVTQASNFYQAGDNLMRVIFFEAELARLKEAGLGDTMTESELKQEAARITNQLYQNYDFVPEAVRRLRKWPIAPFIAFQYEVVRTATNLVKRIRFEINHDNPRIKQIGYNRLIGTLLTSSLGIAMSVASKMILGITEEEEEDVRRFAAPWDRNSTLVFFDSDRGSAKFLNFSYIDPYEYLKDPLLLLLTGRGEDEFLDAFIQSFGKLLEPLMQSEIFIKQFLEVVNNRTEGGGVIANPQAPLHQRVWSIMTHMFDAVSPGFFRNTSNIYEAATEDASKTNRNVPTELLGIFGFRLTTVDFERGLSFKSRDYNGDKRDAKRIYNVVKFDEGSTPLEREKAFQQANVALKAIFEDMSRDVEAARRKGVSWLTIEKTLNDNGVSKVEISRLRFNQFEKFNR